MAGTCTYCSTPLTDNDAFCGNCGRQAPGASTSTSGFSAATVTRSTGPGPAPAVGPQTTRSSWPGSGTGSSPEPDLPLWPSSSSGQTGSVPTAAAAAAAAEVGLGQAGPNAAYLGSRLRYEQQPEQPFDPIANNRYLRAVLARAGMYALIYFMGAFVGGIFFAIAGLAVLGAARGLLLYWICGILIAIAMLCMFWLLPVPALLSEWKLTVDGKAAASPTVFEHIVWTLRRHETPLDSAQVRRLRLPREGSRDYLELRRDLFTGFIGCFAWGQDLYVGWTFWLKLSPFRALCMRIARIWQSATGRGNELYSTLRYDSARAMREAMHSTAREGIDVAVGQLAAQGQGILGNSVQVTDIGV
jgi:MFS family permease